MRTTIAFFFFSFNAMVVIFCSLPQACTNRTGGGVQGTDQRNFRQCEKKKIQRHGHTQLFWEE